MKFGGFLLLLCIVEIGAGEWLDPITLATSNYPFTSHLSYVDQSTGDVHTVFTGGENGIHFVYSRLNSKGETFSYTFSGRRAIIQDFQGSITGANDGKHLYIAMSVMGDYDHYDIFFSESSDNGATWTDPVITRTNKDDTLYRYRPKIDYIKTGKLVIIYDKIGNHFGIATRLPGKTEWEKEKVAVVDFCTSLGNFKAISTAVIYSGETKYTYTFSFKCSGNAKHEIVVGETTDNEQTWKFYTKNEFDSLSSNVPALLTTLPNTNKLYGVFEKSNFVDLAVIYRYVLGGKYEKIFALPLPYIYYHSLIAFERKGKTHFAYINAHGEFHDDQKAILWLITAEDEWKYIRLPLPNPGISSINPKLYFANDHMVMIVRSDDSLLAFRYQFE